MKQKKMKLYQSSLTRQALKNKKTNPIKKIFVFIMFAAIIGIISYVFVVNKDIYLNDKVFIKSGGTMQDIYTKLSSLDQVILKYYIKNLGKDINLKPGYYQFSGDYTKSDLIKILEAGPIKSYISITVLPGYSIYDIDEYLANKGFAVKGDYISFAQDKEIISKYQKRYEFLGDIESLNTLEGFLYPDTYNVDPAKNVIDQLIYLQLDTFNAKVWKDRKNTVKNFTSKLKKNGYDIIDFTEYDLWILASIVEKEENKSANKKIIAGIFLNRLNSGWRLDADISLCYGLKMTYKDCRLVISKNIDDKGNSYNTRANKGITPTPIANISADTIDGLLNFQKSDYMFYLHDSSGDIHASKTNEEHNNLKAQYR